MFNPQLRRRDRGTGPGRNFVHKIAQVGLGTNYTTGERWEVYWNGKHLGYIFQTEAGFDYRKLFSDEQGQSYKSFAACRQALQKMFEETK